MKSPSGQKVLVLGGGLIGLSVAHQLALRGSNVQVISRNKSEAAGFVAAGMLAPHAEALEGKLLELGQISLSMIPKWIKQIETDSGISCRLLFNGIIVPFESALSLYNYPTASFGEFLDRKSLISEIPGIGTRWRVGLLFSNNGQIDNRRFLMRALEKACLALGVNFLEGSDIQGLKTNERGTFSGVIISTASGELTKVSAQKAVLCCGAWSRKLLPNLPIFPVKGQMLSLQAPRNALKRILFGPGTYLVPRDDGLVVVGATNEKNAGFREGLTPSGYKQLHKGVKNMLPVANLWPQMERWWGFRPCTPDQSPFIGESALSGLWLACGHHRNGVLLSAITAELISNELHQIKNKNSKFLEIFRYNRF